MNYLKISDRKVKERAGRNWKQWFRVLDTWNAKQHGHSETAKDLAAKYKIGKWWAQVVTIRYEKKQGYCGTADVDFVPCFGSTIM